ncbi:MAG: tetratricopeptide repeat protein [Sphingomonadaceae bacterium]
MAPIIRTCSALALLLAPTLAVANREPSALALYVQARVADAARAPDVAIPAYAAALSADPDNVKIASRAYREAVNGGDFELALRAARTLERLGSTPPDARLLFYIAAIRARDWNDARSRVTDLAEAPGFGFLAPLFDAWLPKPVTLLNTGARQNAYQAENEALLLLASGNHRAGTAAVKALWALDPYRAGSLRIAAASLLATKGRGAEGAALIQAADMAAVQARAIVSRNGDTGLAVDSPASATAFLLARVSGDLTVEGSGRSSLTIARLAEFAAPENARIRLNVAGALSAARMPTPALAIATALSTDPVYGEDAASLRIELLERVGRVDEALGEARARADRSANDLARVGDIEMRRGSYAAAATIYEEFLREKGRGRETYATLYAAANAHGNAGNWRAARPLLERALVLAPDNPSILNELGYSLIEQGIDLPRGAALIARAAELRPGDPAIIDSLGVAKLRSGAAGEAVKLLERAVRLDIGQAEIGEHLGDAYWAAGRRIDARYAWTAARIQAEGAALARLEHKIARGLP